MKVHWKALFIYLGGMLIISLLLFLNYRFEDFFLFLLLVFTALLLILLILWTFIGFVFDYDIVFRERFYEEEEDKE